MKDKGRGHSLSPLLETKETSGEIGSFLVRQGDSFLPPERKTATSAAHRVAAHAGDSVRSPQPAAARDSKWIVSCCCWLSCCCCTSRRKRTCCSVPLGDWHPGSAWGSTEGFDCWKHNNPTKTQQPHQLSQLNKQRQQPDTRGPQDRETPGCTETTREGRRRQRERRETEYIITRWCIDLFI